MPRVSAEADSVFGDADNAQSHRHGQYFDIGWQRTQLLPWRHKRAPGADGLPQQLHVSRQNGEEAENHRHDHD